MDIENIVESLILEGQAVIEIAEKKGLYDMVYYDGEEYQKWISKSKIFMEKNFRDSQQYDEFLQASKNALGGKKRNYDEMIGILKAIRETKAWGYQGELKDKKKKKIFVSHSSRNKNITDKFVELLKVIGITTEQLYYSSYEETGVGFSEDCLKRISEEFNQNELMVIFMLSREFYNSKVCIAETGATWVNVGSNYIPIIIPPYTYNNIDGVISSTQAVMLLKGEDTDTKIEQLKVRIEEFLEIEEKVNPTEWSRKKSDFIKFINEVSDKLNNIEANIIDVILNKDCQTDMMFKINLINNTQDRVKIEEIKIHLIVDQQAKQISLDEWSVQALVLKPLQEITVYLPGTINEQIKKSKIDIKNSKVIISFYNED